MSSIDNQRIVHLVLGKANPERMNGINRIAHELCCAQRTLGLEAEIWGLTNTPQHKTTERPYPLRLFARGRERFRATPELTAAISELPSSAVFHLHGGFLPEFHAAVSKLKRHGHSWVISPHGSYQRNALARRRIVKSAYRALFERGLVHDAQCVFVNSSTAQRALARWAPAANIVVVPNGVAPPPRLDPLHALDRPEGLLVLYAGRLEHRHKGLDLLLEGLAKARQQTASGQLITLWLVGDGPSRAHLAGLVQKLGLAECVRFEGPRFALEKLARLAAADVFVHTSRHEGMPMAVLEAASAGLPLLLSEGTNLGELARRYDAGFVLSENGPEAIASALLALAKLAAKDRPELERLAANAREMATAEFDWALIATRMLAGYGLSLPNSSAA